RRPMPRGSAPGIRHARGMLSVHSARQYKVTAAGVSLGGTEVPPGRRSALGWTVRDDGSFTPSHLLTHPAAYPPILELLGRGGFDPPWTTRPPRPAGRIGRPERRCGPGRGWAPGSSLAAQGNRRPDNCHAGRASYDRWKWGSSGGSARGLKSADMPSPPG